MKGELQELNKFVVDQVIKNKHDVQVFTEDLKQKYETEKEEINSIVKKCLNVRQKLGTRTLSLSHYLTRSLSQSVSQSLSHSLTHSLSHSLILSFTLSLSRHVFRYMSSSEIKVTFFCPRAI